MVTAYKNDAFQNNAFQVDAAPSVFPGKQVLVWRYDMIQARKQSTTVYPITFFMVDSTDHVTGKTGLSPTVTISKNGGTFAAAAGAVSEIANGWYSLAGNATDRNTLGTLSIHATATGADPVDISLPIVSYDPFADITSILTDTETTLNDLIAAILTDTGTTLNDIVAAILVDTGTTLDTLIKDIPTNSEVATAADLADVVLDEAMVGHVTAGTLGKAVADILESGGTTLNVLVSDIPTNAEMAAALAASDDATLAAIAALNDAPDASVNIAAIKAKTDQLAFTVANQVDSNSLSGVLDAASVRAAIGMAAADLDAQLALIIGGPAGAISWNYTVTDGATPIPGVVVWVTSDPTGITVLSRGLTDNLGVVYFMLDAGTVYVWCYKYGYVFSNPDTEIVA